MRTSWMALTKRQGYTLIEMMVVTLFLALFAAVVVPNYVAIRDGQRRRAFYTSVVDLAGNAREMAITHNATMYLQADTSQNMIVIKQENDDTTYTPADGSAGTPTSSSSSSSSSGNQTATAQSNIGTAQNDRSQDPVRLTLPLSAGVQFGNFQLTGQNSDASSWKLRFFADGTCDGGAVELDDGGNVKSLVVNAHGGASLTDGNIPDTSTQSWAAGNYVQRQQ